MARPQGVYVVRQDGTRLECGLEHLGYDAAENMDNWLVTGVTFCPGRDRLTIAVFPARTGITFDVNFIQEEEHDAQP